MTPVFRVKLPGLHTTVQDAGRNGYADIGLPPSGALDQVAFRLANALVGNEANAAALEVLVSGPTLEVIAEGVHVAFVGGTSAIKVQGGRERSIAAGRGVHLAKGDTLQIGGLARTSCGYLAIAGGISVKPTLGSASTYTRATLGGLEGRALRAGDVIHGEAPDLAQGEELQLGSLLDAEFEAPIRLVLGPQDDHFTEGAIQTLLSATYIVSAEADRMGFRLEGPVLVHKDGKKDIVSDGIVSGSIQVPGSGQPIVLMRDYQTIGGYPKIATIVSSDISRLGRRSPGAKVVFAAVTREQAEAIYREEEAAITARIRDFREARDEASVNVAALYDANLIDGIVSARE